MYKQTTFIIITAAILLAATLATALYSLKEANAQTNKTSAGGNKTEHVSSTNPLTNITIGGQKNITKNSAGGNMTNATG
jgi:Spy/CpxP family protein refolding chaperone